MPYSLQADVRTQTPFKDSTLIGDAYITQKIAEADGIIDAVIGEVYVLPLASTPEIIESLSKALASCLLIQEQDTNIEVQPGIKIADFLKTQMDILEGIRTRKLKLFDGSGDELPLRDRVLPGFYPDATSSDPAATNSTAPKFTMNQQF